MTNDKSQITDFRAYPWRISYRTSSGISQGKAVNILHDFYIPVLKRAVRYDRVAGYFRSSSLAAASQGFSAFLANKGTARFIVGADLAAEDVAAILEVRGQRREVRGENPLITVHNPQHTTHNTQRTKHNPLESILNAQLNGSDAWPESVRNGVQLMGYLIREGILDIRVAFRVHARTGEPLHADSLKDGYVHEKWGIFTDGYGNRIYISGSLNESRTALVINAENIDAHCDWKGDSERARADEASEEFEILWNNRNPAFRVLTLPEAVNQRLIKIAAHTKRPTEIDGSSAAQLRFTMSSAKEFLRFALLKDGPTLPGGRFLGMETSAVTPWPHQDIVARRVISSWPFSYLLCDEVGLGKTIEAGLVIRSLYLSGIVRRVLIAAPASLTEQWQREMAAKFCLPFARVISGTRSRHEFLLPRKIRKHSESLFSPDLNIISTGLLVRKEHRKELEQARDFDLILVDEAHYARRTGDSRGYRITPRFNRLYRTILTDLRPKTACLILATATPMQLHPSEVFDMLRFTRRAGAFQEDPGPANCYYNILGRLSRGKPVSEEEWGFLRKAVTDVARHDPQYYQYLRETVIDGRIRTATRRWLEQGRHPNTRHLNGIQRLIFSAAPLSRVMLRHTRSLLEIYKKKNQLTANLAERIILPLPRITFTDQERTCYDQLEEYCNHLTAKLLTRGDKKLQTSLGFYLSFLRLRFASSLFAIRQTLKRRRKRVQYTLNRALKAENRSRKTIYPSVMAMEDLLEAGDDDAEIVGNFLQNRSHEDLAWEEAYLSIMLDNLSDLSAASSKMTVLLGMLDTRRIPGTGRVRHTVIFTRFYDTLSDITERIRRIDPHIRIGTFSGQGGQRSGFRGEGNQMLGIDREEVKRLFLRNEIDILVCTDAAAEGLNLQTADLLVNFDLPWNPMKVEQRIGRIDRIGQVHDKIYVCNLCYTGSAEEIVYGRLLNRLSRAGDIVGTQQLSLLPVSREDFRDLAEGRLNDTELEKKAKRAVKIAKKRVAAREIPPQDIYHIYLRLKNFSSAPCPLSLYKEKNEQNKTTNHEPRTTNHQPPTTNHQPTTKHQPPNTKHQTSNPIDTIWDVISESPCLRDLGCEIFDKEKKVMILRNIPGVPDRTMMTGSRDTYEYGIDSSVSDTGPIHFSSYGDPVFDAFLNYAFGDDMPKYITRLRSDSSDYGYCMTGYAAVCIGSDGDTQVRLITSFGDLEGTDIDESAELTAEDLIPLQKRLNEMAHEEFRHIRMAGHIEDLNTKAATSQLLLNYLLISSLMRLRQRFHKGEPSFRAEVRSIEEKYKDQDFQQIPDIDKDKAEKLQGLLFDLQIPISGDKAVINAPGFLIMTALDAVCRLAHRMRPRKKRAELMTADVLNRLDREIRRLLKISGCS